MYNKLEHFPLTGPLEVKDYNKYLEESKGDFYKQWDIKWAEKSSLDDFVILKKLGAGSFGIVFLVQYKNDGSYKALKTLDKKNILKSKQKGHLKNERNLLKCLNFPFTIYMEHFFMDNSFLYFVTPFITGGELFIHLTKHVKFKEEEVRFFGAQVVLTIEYLHSLNIVYRDLKPENLLIDCTGYLKLADFGFAKIIKHRTYTLCGTPEYIAPEIILNKGYGKSVDWWSVGVLLFELVSGKTPFYHKKVMQMYERAAVGKYIMPQFFSKELQDLLKNILQPDLTRRFGNLQNGAGDIKNHVWFRSIDWLMLFNRKIQAPYVPKEISFDISDSNEKVVLDVATIDIYHKEFESF